MKFIKKEQKEMKLIGMSVVLCGKQSENNQKIQKLWKLFNKSLWKVKNRVPADQWVKYGMTSNAIPGKQYTYMAAVEVSDCESVPDGMIKKVVPSHKVICFHHQGSYSRLNQTYNLVYKEWIPSVTWCQANPNHVGFNHYERYDYRFKWASPDSIIEICIPAEA